MKPLCEFHTHQILERAGTGEDTEELYEMVRCPNEARITIDGDSICWDHAESEYGFDTKGLT